MTLDTHSGRDVKAVAAKLTRAQREYLLAVSSASEPYEPRHGRTANWALRHRLVDTIVVLNDGQEGAWESFDADARAAIGISGFRGQRLTALGRATLETDHG